MRIALRTFGLIAALAASTGMGMTPASAASVGAFTGNATIACFGCGDSAGTADLCWTGIVAPTTPSVCLPQLDLDGDGEPDIPPEQLANDPNTTATYTVHEGTGIDCVISGSADGFTEGAVAVTFNWNRLGAVAQINTDPPGSGVALFLVTGPVGPVCGAHNLTAYVVGELHTVP